MKTLELNLQKRLLIVEGASEIVVGQYELDVNGRDIELICKGSELTEEIAMELVMEMYSSNEERMMYRDYKAKYDDEVIYNALESFISAIEAQGYYWGKNPIEKPDDLSGLGSPFDNLITEEIDKWFMADVLTFNPDQTLIFEII